MVNDSNSDYDPLGNEERGKQKDGVDKFVVSNTMGKPYHKAMSDHHRNLKDKCRNISEFKLH